MIWSLLLHHWQWVAAVFGVIILAGAVMNPAVSLPMLAAIPRGTVRVLVAFVAWARKPHDWWRIGCLTVAASALTAGLYANGLRREIVVVTEKARVAVAECKAELGKQETATNASKAALKTCSTTLTAEVGKRKAVEQATAQAIKDARADASAAERKMAEWQKRYSEKPAGCNAALQQVEAQCKSIRDY